MKDDVHRVFSQNEGLGGFQEGLYDALAHYPTGINWTRQLGHSICSHAAVKWEITLKENIHTSSPVIGEDGTIYFGSNGGYLYAINPNGTIKWELELARYLDVDKMEVSISDLSLQTPSIGSNGYIYISTSGPFDSLGHKVFAITPSGTVEWEFELGESSLFCPVISKNGTIYVITRGAKLFAINSDGTLKWEFERSYGFNFAPVIAQDGTVYTGGGKSFYAVNPDGTEKWCIPLGNTHKAIPVIDSKGVIYFEANHEKQCKLFSINPDGSIKWIYTPEQDIWSSTALRKDGTLIVASTFFKILAINCDGTLQWESKVEGFITAPPIVGRDGEICISTSEEARGGKRISKVFLLDKNGSVQCSVKVKGSVTWPAIGKNGEIYLLTKDPSLSGGTGKLFVIGQKDKTRKSGR